MIEGFKGPCLPGYKPNAMTAAPASATIARLPCSTEAAPMNSDETALELEPAFAAPTLLLALPDELVGTALPEGRRTVDVAVAW